MTLYLVTLSIWDRDGLGSLDRNHTRWLSCFTDYVKDTPGIGYYVGFLEPIPFHSATSPHHVKTIRFTSIETYLKSVMRHPAEKIRIARDEDPGCIPHAHGVVGFLLHDIEEAFRDVVRHPSLQPKSHREAMGQFVLWELILSRAHGGLSGLLELELVVGGELIPVVEKVTFVLLEDQLLQRTLERLRSDDVDGVEWRGFFQHDQKIKLTQEGPFRGPS